MRIDILKAWEEFWKKQHLPDEAFIAPGYIGAEVIAEFCEQHIAVLEADKAQKQLVIDSLRENIRTEHARAEQAEAERDAARAELSWSADAMETLLKLLRDRARSEAVPGGIEIVCTGDEPDNMGEFVAAALSDLEYAMNTARAALASAEVKLRPRIVCLCGSTKFRADFERASMEETLAGNIVLSVGMFGHEIGLDMAGKEKKALDKLHFRKIEMADEVVIVHPDYIGLSTCDEYHYALALCKPVRFQRPQIGEGK